MPIIPIMERTPEERREIARKGGLAKAANAKRRRQLHACRYDDIAALRNEVASLARLSRDLLQLLNKADPYNYDIQDLKQRANKLLKHTEERERKDTARIMYGEAEAGELPPV